MDKQQTLDLEFKMKGPVECLGMTFESDEARRAYFLERLKEKLQDPEFRKVPGFPKGTDADILRMSDPPYYTACPNPFLAKFVREYGRPYDPDEEYHREPFAVDVSVGKTDGLYRAHSYHTKVPHLAIVPSILHYTAPGDLVLDGFCGSGMTGLAAVWCGAADHQYRRQVESAWAQEGKPAPKWGSRRALLSDLSPAATFIAANYCTPVSLDSFAELANVILTRFSDNFGWMYQTRHTNGSLAPIDFTVWSEVFTCPSCGADVNFIESALDPETKKVAKELTCSNCQAHLTKVNLERSYTTVYDPVAQESIRTVRRVPVLIQYTYGEERFEKRPDEHDLQILQKIDEVAFPGPIPSEKLPYMHMTHERARLELSGISHSHHFHLRRSLVSLSYLWKLARQEPDTRLRNMLLYLVEQTVWGMSVLARYAPTHFSQVNRYLSGVYYVGSQIVDVSPSYILSGKLHRLAKAFQPLSSQQPAVAVGIADCGALPLADNAVDYIFTDPPFGENIYYSDLNYLLESWHRVYTAADNEAIVDRAKKKDLSAYQDLMTRAFKEYWRVLKPGRWATVVFSNSSNSVWRAIQEGMGRAGFVIADVRTLDKQQGSYRQVTSSAMKQDLVISAYKPTETMTARFSLRAGSAESAWTFVDEHLTNVPLFVAHGHESEVVAERTAQMLLDRMIAFHVQRGVGVPIDAGEFFRGLENRYAKRDGMYFLQDQVLEYDKKRAKVETVKQLSFDVTDEASAILWLRVELDRKPQSFQDLQPTFMRESQTWAGHEKTVELKEILEENFLLHDGTGPVPAQIHTYLSTNFKDMRGLSKDDPTLKAKAADRWYVPDPNKQSDLEQLRAKRLLKEFLEYKESKQKKLKQFRTEAIRAGFKAAYDQKDYRTIIDVAKKLPEQVVQEDEKLLMYYDVASMRLGED